MVALICSGSSRWISFISARTRRITSSELALGSAQIPTNTAVSPLKFTITS